MRAPLPPVEVASPVLSHGFAPTSPITPTEGTYIPFQSAPQGSTGFTRSLTYTRSVWWICGQPVWSIVPQLVLIALVGLHAATTLTLGLAALNLASWFVLIALASADRSALLTGGNRSAASPLWMLLSPLAYLIARSIQVRRWDASGWVPLIWWIVATVISPILGVVGVFAVLGVLPI